MSQLDGLSSAELAYELASRQVHPVKGARQYERLAEIAGILDARDAARAALEATVARLTAENTTLTKELNDIKWTMSLCGIGDYKTWKQAQDEAYRVVLAMSGEHQAFTEFFAVAKTVAGLLDHGRTAEAIRRLDDAISAEEQRVHDAANPPGADAGTAAPSPADDNAPHDVGEL